MSAMAAEELSQIPMSQALAASLARASDGARATGASEITLEHVLAALCDDPDAGDVLKASNIDSASLRAETIAYLARAAGSAAHAGQGDVSVSPAVKRILEAAAAAARGGRRRDINGAIVLAAIVGDGRSIAAQILQARGMTFDGAIRALQSAMAQPARDAPIVAPAEDVLARARERVQSRSAPSLRDIMREMPQSAPGSQHPQITHTDIVPSPPFGDAARPAPDSFAAQAESVPAYAAPAPMEAASRDGAKPAEVQAVEAKSIEAKPSSARDVAATIPAATTQAADGEPVAGAAQPAAGEAQAKPAAPVAADPPAPSSPGQINPFPPASAPSSPGPAGPAGQAGHASAAAGADPKASPPPPSVNPLGNQEFAQSGQMPARPTPPPPPQIHGQVERSTAIKPPPIPPPIPRAPPQPVGYAPPPPARRPPGIGAASPEPTRLPGYMPPGSMGHGQLPPGPPLPGLRVPAPGSAPPPTQASPPRQIPPQAPGPARKREAPANQREAPAKAELGELAENVPRKMRVGVSERVEVRIARGRVKAITEGMEGGGLAWRHDVTVTKAMSVRLRAPEGGFFIETASPETQWIEQKFADAGDDYASWRFLVTPNARGWSRLQIIVSARTVGADGLAAETAFPDQVVEVKVKSNLKRAFVRWSGWIVAAVMGGALAKFGEGAFEAGAGIVAKFMH